MMFFTLEFIGLSNIRVHVRIFREMRNTFIDTHRSLVNSQRSDQSDHDTRIRYPGWAASKQSLQAPLSFFLPQATLGLLRSLSSRDFYHLFYFQVLTSAALFQICCLSQILLYRAHRLHQKRVTRCQQRSTP